MVSVNSSVLFRVEGLLRFTSKLACRYLRQLSRNLFYFIIWSTPGPSGPPKGHFWILFVRSYWKLYGNLRRPCAQIYVCVFRLDHGGPKKSFLGPFWVQTYNFRPNLVKYLYGNLRRPWCTKLHLRFSIRVSGPPFPQL